jgi:hypothetical protein
LGNKCKDKTNEIKKYFDCVGHSTRTFIKT